MASDRGRNRLFHAADARHGRYGGGLGPRAAHVTARAWRVGCAVEYRAPGSGVVGCVPYFLGAGVEWLCAGRRDRRRAGRETVPAAQRAGR